ncbi:FABP family protein [Dermabacteraceae bacterium CCM 9520]
MPIILDSSLDPSLYPLAWLVGSWEGSGAVQLPGDDGEEVGKRIEQTLQIKPSDSKTLAWQMRTWVLDVPPPAPPTAAFVEGAEEEPETPQEGEIERRLLTEESGYWRVTGPVREGETEAQSPHKVELLIAHPEGYCDVYLGEVRGPRIHLATDFVARTETGTGPAAAMRMFGLVRGNLMWAYDTSRDDKPLSSYMSVELGRAADEDEADYEMLGEADLSGDGNSDA